jgi:hypothetical protein
VLGPIFEEGELAGLDVSVRLVHTG